MLLPEGIYRRIPQYWMLIGILFLVLGLFVGTTYRLFPAYLGFGILCVARSIWIYQARWHFHKRNELRMTQSIQVTRRSSREP